MNLLLPKPRRTLPAERRRIKFQSARELARLEAMADRICGALVKLLAGNRCEARGYLGIKCSPGLDWAHGLRRDFKSVRWAHSNTFALCREHHEAFGDEAVFETWRVLRLGRDLVDAVAEQARPTWRGDVREVIDGLRECRFIQGERA